MTNKKLQATSRIKFMLKSDLAQTFNKQYVSPEKSSIFWSNKSQKNPLALIPEIKINN
jgi:hypothetical protein